MDTTPVPAIQSMPEFSGAVPSSRTSTAVPEVPASANQARASSNRSALIMTSAHSQRRKVSQDSLPPDAVGRMVENTYRLHPTKPFPGMEAKRLMIEAMEKTLDGKRYDQEACKQLTTTLTDLIQTGVKALDHPRYKLVTSVAIGQLSDASVAFTSRCVWNDSFDLCVEHSYRNGSLYAVATVHAVYCD